MAWSNWSGSQRVQPAVFARPNTREEVARQVAQGFAPVRVAGSGHSFSPCVVTRGTLLSLDALDKVLDADASSGLVRVEAGIRLRALSPELHRRGLAMPNMGDIDAQSLAGALATATHGTGTRLPNLSAQVVAMELVLADGSTRTISDGDELRAARVSLGALGVVVAVTLQTVPSYRLHNVDRPEPLEDVLDGLQERADAHDHFEFWTFPHSPVALTRSLDRTDAPVRMPARPRALFSDVVMENGALEVVSRIGRRFPGAIPRLNRFAGTAASKRDRVGWSHDIYASRRMVRFEEMEYALPRERAAEAVRTARDILQRYPVNFPIELRFAAADDALLSTAHGRDTTYVAVHVFKGMDYETPFKEVEAALAALDGRPHWGKRSWLKANQLAPRYPRWDAFQEVRRALDPGRRFSNAWAEDVLG
jgi:L-gulono-1,4-lactone dehydrogenase